MAEEKKGRVRITMEIEVNEVLMDLARESMEKMPEMWARFRKKEQEQR